MIRNVLILLCLMFSLSVSAAYSGEDDYDDLIHKAAAKYGVPFALLKSIIKQESAFDPNAVSGANPPAVGLMQLTPIAVLDLKQRLGIDVTDRTDPAQSINAGAAYFALMLKQNNGDVALALAAYNAGQGNVDKYGGVPPFKETIDYVKRIASNYTNYGGPGFYTGGVPPAGTGAPGGGGGGRSTPGGGVVLVAATNPGVLSSAKSAAVIKSFETFLGLPAGVLGRILVGLTIGLLFIFAVLQIIKFFQASAMGGAGSELTRFQTAGIMTARTLVLVSILYFFFFNSM